MQATKNISDFGDSKAVIIYVIEGEERWIATYETTPNGQIKKDCPIKVVHKMKEERLGYWSSFYERDVTEELLERLASVQKMWDDAPSESQRVFM